MALSDLPQQAYDAAKQVLRTGTYALALPCLLHIKQKPAKNVYSRFGKAIDEVVLHGTESKATSAQSVDYLASKNSASTSIHYFIGREFGEIYASVPEDKAAGHAGNPKRIKGIQDHNFRSIGIELYPWDISLFHGDKTKLDFTEWQYAALAQLCYDICRRRKLKPSQIVGHEAINAVQRGDPRGFDWEKFSRLLEDLSKLLAQRLGADYALTEG